MAKLKHAIRRKIGLFAVRETIGERKTALVSRPLKSIYQTVCESTLPTAARTRFE